MSYGYGDLSPTEKTTITKRVKRCVKVLDQVMPDWRTRIDCCRLDLGDVHSCVLGQLHGNFNDVVKGVYGASQVTLSGFDNKSPHLFALDYGPRDTFGYADLTEGWRKVLGCKND